MLPLGACYNPVALLVDAAKTRCEPGSKTYPTLQATRSRAYVNDARETDEILRERSAKEDALLLLEHRLLLPAMFLDCGERSLATSYMRSSLVRLTVVSTRLPGVIASERTDDPEEDEEERISDEETASRRLPVTSVLYMVPFPDKLYVSTSLRRLSIKIIKCLSGSARNVLVATCTPADNLRWR